MEYGHSTSASFRDQVSDTRYQVPGVQKIQRNSRAKCYLILHLVIPSYRHLRCFFLEASTWSLSSHYKLSNSLRRELGYYRSTRLLLPHWEWLPVGIPKRGDQLSQSSTPQ